MTETVRTLEPQNLWNYFADLNAVPRPSKHEERVVQFVLEFGKSLGLETLSDEAGNVIIRKPATPGMEQRKPLVLQSHLDMVHQKNAGTDFDFNIQGIEMYTDGDWVKAKGTTLGADNGIGVASIMAVLASSDIAHPPLEALFTIDEETGMTGAFNLKPGALKGCILLNLDTEEDHELTIGCAGGVDVTASGTYTTEKLPSQHTLLKLTVKGLTGGHSGMDIYKGRANANKILNRLLYHAAQTFEIKVVSLDGGSLRNAIPREAVAEIAVPDAVMGNFRAYLQSATEAVRTEYQTTDPNLIITLESNTGGAEGLNGEFQDKLLRALYACQNGVYRMSPEILHLVQTSNNLARVLVKDGSYSIQCLTRGSVDSEKMDLAHTLKATFELMGSTVDFKGAYPGWAPNPGASIVRIMRALYTELYSDQPNVSACHAGLECGIIGANYPEMEMISFGPNIYGAHSPDERVQISSVQKFWRFLLETLKRIPEQS